MSNPMKVEFRDDDVSIFNYMARRISEIKHQDVKLIVGNDPFTRTLSVVVDGEARSKLCLDGYTHPSNLVHDIEKAINRSV